MRLQVQLQVQLLVPSAASWAAVDSTCCDCAPSASLCDTAVGSVSASTGHHISANVQSHEPLLHLMSVMREVESAVCVSDRVVKVI